ncbi:hypothetical protein NDU88_005190 [Pleurodeles waltl]|uniref:Uncharacterized protein n=1 Tax=Pleurodeles waltl TaxID=8319 RepID=A0AAV7QEK4_PLEWA|nr:hypothetical protein NDU88_005190 [Pleurodeles waltl]
MSHERNQEVLNAPPYWSLTIQPDSFKRGLARAYLSLYENATEYASVILSTRETHQKNAVRKSHVLVGYHW